MTATADQAVYESGSGCLARASRSQSSSLEVNWHPTPEKKHISRLPLCQESYGSSYQVCGNHGNQIPFPLMAASAVLTRVTGIPTLERCRAAPAIVGSPHGKYYPTDTANGTTNIKTDSPSAP
jgi:hypothetical protein